MRRLAVFLAFIAAGCAPSAPQRWTNPDLATLDPATREREAQKAMAHCRMIAEGVAPPQQIIPGNNSVTSGFNMGAALGSKKRRTQVFEDCMISQGWVEGALQ